MPIGIKGFRKGHKINVGRIFSAERNKKISERLKGKPQPWNIGHKSRFPKGYITWNKGLKGTYKHTEEWKKNHSKRMSKENHPNWKGGISCLSYSSDWTETLKRSIRERDKYICQICGKNQIIELENIGKKLAIHHTDYDKKNNDPKNLITLCNNCHSKTNWNKNYWIEYFNLKKGRY